MNEFEKQLLRLEELQRQLISVPGWAKAEKLEACTAQSRIYEVCRTEKARRIPAGSFFCRKKMQK